VPMELSILSGTATPGAMGVENLNWGFAGARAGVCPKAPPDANKTMAAAADNM